MPQLNTDISANLVSEDMATSRSKALSGKRSGLGEADVSDISAPQLAGTSHIKMQVTDVEEEKED